MSITMKSLVHLGPEHQQNRIACRNTNFEEIKTLFDITLRLIVNISFEILNLSTMTNDFYLWMRSTLCHDQVIKWAKAKVHVYSDLVLCLLRISHLSKANTKWKEQTHCFPQSGEHAEMSGSDGESIEFGWNTIWTKMITDETWCRFFCLQWIKTVTTATFCGPIFLNQVRPWWGRIFRGIIPGRLQTVFTLTINDWFLTSAQCSESQLSEKFQTNADKPQE